MEQEPKDLNISEKRNSRFDVTAWLPTLRNRLALAGTATLALISTLVPNPGAAKANETDRPSVKVEVGCKQEFTIFPNKGPYNTKRTLSIDAQNLIQEGNTQGLAVWTIVYDRFTNQSLPAVYNPSSSNHFGVMFENHIPSALYPAQPIQFEQSDLLIMVAWGPDRMFLYENPTLENFSDIITLKEINMKNAPSCDSYVFPTPYPYYPIQPPTPTPPR